MGRPLPNPPEEIILAFDMKLMRPGCVLLQAVYGGSTQAASMFDTRTWLLAPTPDLKPYKLPTSRLKEVVEKTHKHHRIGT